MNWKEEIKEVATGEGCTTQYFSNRGGEECMGVILEHNGRMFFITHISLNVWKYLSNHFDAREWLRVWINACRYSMIKKERKVKMKHEKELIHPDELMKYYGQIVDPLRDHDRELLRKKAVMLKQSDGEGWACGEALIRIINLLSMCELFTRQELENDE